MSNQIAMPAAGLKQAVAGLGKVIARRTTLPVLGAVRVYRDRRGRVEVSGTDLDSFAAYRFEEPQEGGEACAILPLADLAAVVRGCGACDTVTLEAEGPHVVVRSPIGGQTAERRFGGFDPGDFPEHPALGHAKAGELDEGAKSALVEAMACASRDERRYVLQGAYLDVSDRSCHHIVGTDGRHLYSSNSFELPLGSPVIVPMSAFLDWKGFQRDGAWSLATGKWQGSLWLGFESGHWRLTIKAVEGSYPDWRHVVPDEESFLARIKLAPEAVAAALRMIPHMPGSQKDVSIGLKVEGGRLDLCSRADPESEWTRLGVEAAVFGTDTSVMLDRKYLLKALQCGLGDISLADAESPVLFKDGGRRMIVMPMRVTGVDSISGARNESPAKETAKREAGEEQPPPPPDAAEEATGSEQTTNQNERKTMHTQTHGTNGERNGGSRQEENPEATPALEAGLLAAQGLRERLRELAGEAADIVALLRGAERERKAGEREIRAARGTLERLKAVSL